MNKIPDDQFPVAAAALPADQAPAPDFESSVCMKGKDGKCGHLWQLTTSFNSGNPTGTFEEGEEPRETHRVCLRSPSNEMSLTQMVVFTCNEHTDHAMREDPKPFVMPTDLPPLVPPPTRVPLVANAPQPELETEPGIKLAEPLPKESE